MEFWNDIATDKSWKVLQELVKKISPILIGGWACYLLTKKMKSKDVDIIVDFPILTRIKEEFGLKKNEKLKKYETIINEISIDIYVPYYSKLILPIELIQKNTRIVDGIKVPQPEILLILKQQAEIARGEKSLKGQKDRVDILSILMNTEMNWKNYYRIIKEQNIEHYAKQLKKIIIEAKKEFSYFDIENLRQIKLIKRKLLREIQGNK